MPFKQLLILSLGTNDPKELSKYLNKDDMAWVKPLDHFGRAYAEVDENQENLNICSNKDGEYNVLLIATRKDKDATQHWKGAERDD